MTMKKYRKTETPLLVGMKCGINQIAVWCPYCLKYHFHGWDHTKTHDGANEHRCAHCEEGSPFIDDGYYIALQPPLKQ